MKEEGKNQEEYEKQNTEVRKAYDYDNHINELLKEILSYNRKEGLEKFEELSMYIKKKMTKLSFLYFKPKNTIQNKVELTLFEQNVLSDSLKHKKSLTLIDNYIQDIISQSKLLEWAGVSFNKTEWYKINISMKVIFQDDLETSR